MKKLCLLFILCICLLFSTPVYVHASSCEIDYNSVIDDTISEIVNLETYFHYDKSRTSTYVSAIREIKYEENIVPATSIFWTENINGTNYSGTLYLQSFYQSSGNTIATYKGTLYPVN